MTKRSIVAVLIVAALLLISSCDAETFMRKFGTNVLGGVGGAETINQLEEQIDLIIGGEENPADSAPGEIIDSNVRQPMDSAAGFFTTGKGLGETPLPLGIPGGCQPLFFDWI